MTFYPKDKLWPKDNLRKSHTIFRTNMLGHLVGLVILNYHDEHAHSPHTTSIYPIIWVNWIRFHGIDIRITLLKNIFQVLGLVRRKTVQWRHIAYDDISNYQPPDCLFNRLFEAQIKESIKAPRRWPFVRGIRRWPLNSPNKEPVTRKVFPFDDVIMILNSVPVIKYFLI